MIKYYNKILLSLTEVKGHSILLIHALTGCAFHCFKCFNYNELIANTPKEYYTIDDVIETIIQQDKLYEYIIFSGGEFLLGILDDLRNDLKKVRDISKKPIIVYTTGFELTKMKKLFEEDLIDGFHMDMKLPYHLLNMDDVDLIELTMGIKVSNLVLFEKLLKALEFVIATDKGYNRVRSVKYPFLNESAFEENKNYISELNIRYNKNVPYDVNDFIYTDEENIN